MAKFTALWFVLMAMVCNLDEVVVWLGSTPENAAKLIPIILVAAVVYALMHIAERIENLTKAVNQPRVLSER